MTNIRTLAESVETMELEDAYEFAGKLFGQERRELSGLTIFTGVHPDHGPVSVIVPAFGEGIIFYQFVAQY